MVSFTLTAGSGDPSSVQDGMPKEVELLQKGKAWESVGLLKGKRLKGADGSTGRKSHQIKLCGQEDW
jgi:hypothetical protein